VRRRRGRTDISIMRVLVTGSSGLIGSEAVTWYDATGHDVIGIDNNMRAEFFGQGGDTRWNLARLKQSTRRFEHHDLDIRDREGLLRVFARQPRPFDLIVHCAAQPSHDKARDIPLTDFDVNAVGTVNMLEAARRHAPEAAFCFMSTNKVYGDVPNELPLVELAMRFDYARHEDRNGIDETCRIDRCLHSVFGASKVAADIMVQEYGRYYGLKTACFRGGCLTGPAHSGVQLHGFLSYLVKVTVRGEPYRVFGYKGKQVRDNIHCADVIAAFEAFRRSPRCGEVYNLGGGRDNSVSMIEAIARIEALAGRKLQWTYEDDHRTGDHICYISNLARLQSHFPDWRITHRLDGILEEMVRVAVNRAA
jgi:CDP-paratose 2-epimerase